MNHKPAPKVVLTNHLKPNIQTEVMAFFTCVGPASEWCMKRLEETLANIAIAVEFSLICYSYGLMRFKALISINN
jgi:hypothetical protein